MLKGFLAHSLNKDYNVGKYPIVSKLSENSISIALFSLYLTPKSVDSAEITFGGIDESKFNGEIARTLEYYRVKY